MPRPREVVADRARRIGKPGHVVEIGAALRPVCIAYAVAGIRDCERAVSEEESEAETGACEAHVRLWDREQLGAPPDAGSLALRLSSRVCER